MPALRPGKVSSEILQKYVFPYLGTSDTDVIHGPGIGRDAALVRVGRQVAAATTDPITGAIQQIGAYAVHICANDIATFGIRPRWFLATILLPENFEPILIKEIMFSMDQAAKKLNVSIIGGHSEFTVDLKRPIVVGFMLGVTNEGQYVTSAAAHPGDSLILTKGAAIEGTAILATERENELLEKLDHDLITSAQQFIRKISVVPEALKAMSTGAVTAMHDPTEGGVSTGLHELADASGVGFKVNRDAIVIYEETRQLCQLLRVNPLHLIASGAMLISVKTKKASHVLKTLNNVGIEAALIGELVQNPAVRIIVDSDGTEKPLLQPSEDVLWEALSKPI